MHADRVPYETVRASFPSSLERAPPRAARREIIEWVLFWLLVAALALAPLWYGSNDLVAWGINALCFPGLAVLYEAAILVRGESHPVGLKNLALPAALFAAVVGWAWLQTVTWPHSPLAHPIWGMAGDVLGRPLGESISVNRDLTTLALTRLITAASVFWLALQLCRHGARARLLLNALVVIICIYAAYALAALNLGSLPWLEIPPNGGYATAPFVNRDSFATYAGLGLVVICGLILQLYRNEVMTASRRLQIASLIEATGQKGALLLGGGFLLLVALLVTGSRGGIIATGFGLFALGALTFRRAKTRAAEPLLMIAVGAVLVAATLFTFGDAFLGSVAERGVGDTGRLAVYLITLRSILDAPLFGHGYGTFADVFPMYRDRSISVQGAWLQAHDTYLEVFQGLGLVFGSMLVACVFLFVLRCIRGAMTRQENVTVPRVAAGAAFLVGIHASVDFSLQIQAVALTFIAILGAGVAQAESSRVSLND